MYLLYFSYTDVIRIRATKIGSFRKKYACTQRKSRRPRCGPRLSASEQLGLFCKEICVEIIVPLPCNQAEPDLKMRRFCVQIKFRGFICQGWAYSRHIRSIAHRFLNSGRAKSCDWKASISCASSGARRISSSRNHVVHHRHPS